MAQLWLVRHARPLVAAGICYGRLDLAADAQATRQAAETLAPSVGPGWAVVCSPSRRCRQLADEIVRLRPDLAPSCDPRLAEMDFGSWEGRPWSEIGAEALAAWTADFAHHRPGGGESVAGFMERVGAALADLPGQDTVWITHAGVIRAALLLNQGVDRVRSAADWPDQPIAFGSCTVLQAVARSGPGSRTD